MQLTDILSRIAKTIEYVDKSTIIQNINKKTGPYLQSYSTLFEKQQVSEIFQYWPIVHPDDSLDFSLEVNYPSNKKIRCDAGISLNPNRKKEALLDWALELKYLRSIGDNGKKNDFFVGKAVSPYLHERSSVLDAKRLSDELSTNKFCKKAAVIMYGFEYSEDSIRFSERVSESTGEYGRFHELKKTVDSFGGNLSLSPIIDLFEVAARQYVKLGPVQTLEFGPLEKHPCATHGKLIGWEILCGGSNS